MEPAGHHLTPAESGGSSEGGRDARLEDRNEHKSSSVPKADAWKEKNRLAQRAFRQRQKVPPLPACAQYLCSDCVCLNET